MAAEEALFTALSTNAAVLALVGPTASVARIYPDVVPETSDMPAIAFVRTGTEFIGTVHAIAPSAMTVTLQVTCVATTRVSANALAFVVVTAAAVSGFIAVDQSAADDFENGLFAAVVSFLFNE